MISHPRPYLLKRATRHERTSGGLPLEPVPIIYRENQRAREGEKKIKLLIK
jgi:hypothetical protein